MNILPRAASLLIGLHILLGIALASADEGSLEARFEAGNYPEFFASATPAADRGDAGALFLLGKAYHLGKGVETNLDTARSLYEAARERGSARASHNLGVLALHARRHEDAIVFLEEALDRGFKLPTYYNLGRAYTPPDPDFPSDLTPYTAAAGKAGDAYAQAYELDRNPAAITAAARQYLRAYLMERKDGAAAADDARLQSLRARAAEWLTMAMERNDGAAATNHGVRLLEENDLVGAVAMFERGARANINIAHFHLGRIAETGIGPSGADRTKALHHYEAAAHLDLEVATERARALLSEQLRLESDPDALAAGLERLDRLPSAQGFVYTERLLRERLVWARVLEKHKQNAGPLKSRPLFLRACGLNIGQTIGDRLNLGQHLAWRLTAARTLGTEEELGFDGRIDEHGCAHLKAPLPASVRTRLEQGEVLLLQFPAVSVPLSLVETGDSIRLVVLPSTEPAAH